MNHLGMKALGMQVFVGGIIAMCLTGTGMLIFSALGDESFAVEPDYYAKSLRWNEAARQREQNSDLGWDVHVTGDAAATSSAATEPLTIFARVTDRAGAPLAGATVAGEAFLNSRAKDRLSLDFMAGAELGTYSSTLPPTTHGTYHIRIAVVRANERFTAELDYDPSTGTSSPAPQFRASAPRTPEITP
jgi:hypothetical protein